MKRGDALDYDLEREELIVTERLGPDEYGASSVEGRCSPMLGRYIMKLVALADAVTPTELGVAIVALDRDDE